MPTNKEIADGLRQLKTTFRDYNKFYEKVINYIENADFIVERVYWNDGKKELRKKIEFPSKNVRYISCALDDIESLIYGQSPEYIIRGKLMHIRKGSKNNFLLLDEEKFK